jgi:hypothetical protein
LLIFDNLDNLEIVKEFWPHGGVGSVIITSRNPESQHTLAKNGTKVEPFARSEGKDFLMTMLPGSDITMSNPATLVSSMLGGLPLALKQMAAFVRESGCSVQQLLVFLRDKSQQQSLFKGEGDFPDLDYEHTVYTAWEVSLSRLSATQMNTLGCLCFLDPDAISQVVMSGLWSACATRPTLFPHVQNELMLVLPSYISNKC